MIEKNKKRKLKLIISVFILFISVFIIEGILSKKEENHPLEEVKQILPQVYFEGNIEDMTSKEDIRDIKLKYESRDFNFEANAKIKIQGTSSIYYDKKNYTIELYNNKNYDQKMNIDVGFGSESKYTLKANWIDKTHARNIVTARIVSDIQKRYNLFSNTPYNGEIDGFPIEIYINGEFLGLYTWNIPKSSWMFGMDEDNPNHIVLSGSAWTDGVLFKELTSFNEWDVEVGKQNELTLNKFNRLVGFVKNSTDEEFKTEFSQYLNIDATINYYIMLQFAMLVDNGAKNMLMVTYDGEIWYPSLYDLDTSFGTSYDGINILDYQSIDKTSNSYLWKKLTRNFPNEIKVRYFELRSNILTKENILEKFREFESGIPDEVLEKEMLRWGNNIPGYDISQIEDFLDVRIPLIDDFMKNL